MKRFTALLLTMLITVTGSIAIQAAPAPDHNRHGDRQERYDGRGGHDRDRRHDNRRPDRDRKDHHKKDYKKDHKKNHKYNDRRDYGYAPRYRSPKYRAPQPPPPPRRDVRHMVRRATRGGRNAVWYHAGGDTYVVRYYVNGYPYMRYLDAALNTISAPQRIVMSGNRWYVQSDPYRYYEPYGNSIRINLGNGRYTPFSPNISINIPLPL